MLGGFFVCALQRGLQNLCRIVQNHAEVCRRFGRVFVLIVSLHHELLIISDMERAMNQETGQFLFVSESQLRGIINEEVTKALSQVKDKPRRMYTRFEVRDILNVTLGTIDNMVKRGELQAIKLGHKVMFDADEVDEAIEKGRVRKYKHQV